MKQQFVLVILFLMSVSLLTAQDKFYTKNGVITFHSKAPLENIEADNKTVTCVLDAKTGNLQFAVLIKSFEFEKALMQEHFNENYLESHKYPKADFKGQVVNNSEINYLKDGIYPAKVKGKLTLHGETKEIETTGNIIIKAGKVKADASFSIELDHYKIEIPKVVKDNISNTVKITVVCSMDPLKS